MTWMVFTHSAENDRLLAAHDYLATAMSKDLHLVEPRLARLAAEFLAETRGLTAAEEVALAVLADRTSDPAYDELELWLTWHEQAAVVALQALKPRNITHRRLARPEGRVNPNPYLPR